MGTSLQEMKNVECVLIYIVPVGISHGNSIWIDDPVFPNPCGTIFEQFGVIIHPAVAG